MQGDARVYLFPPVPRSFPPPKANLPVPANLSIYLNKFSASELLHFLPPFSLSFTSFPVVVVIVVGLVRAIALTLF